VAAQQELEFTISGVVAAFRSYMEQIFDTSRNQMINWRLDNQCTFKDQVDHSIATHNQLGED
jgi:hypothetical protein